ncbi:PREDICTED: probable linoleate 9S-lipoxygenase 5 [Ipomoea nil]|uniref:probable linoleate 9S-lipoxygenase 5 n=1 Tax=Ipomoea nil TaxID=35883 RepID=UPI0009009CFC|nr:PREDICTED: probable linoleate 9S-lipoxygenase 5 [Ipomoea nil]
MILGKIVGAITGKHDAAAEEKPKIIKGTVVLMKKNALDLKDIGASVLDTVHELVGQKVSFELISAVNADPEKGLQGKRGKVSYLENWSKPTPLAAGESAYEVTFEWDESIGVPGAFVINNNHHSEFYLKTLTLEDVPNHGPVQFVCFSWVYPAGNYNYERIFFTNQAYLPSQTPAPLLPYREAELKNLRGDGTGERKEWDRVYDYDCYNDLGDPDNGKPRPILGGNTEYPYPRRGRTGRKMTKTDPHYESRLSFLAGIDIYVPRDEKFGHLKFSDFLGYALKSLGQFLLPEMLSLFDKTPNEFDTFDDVNALYEGGLSHGPILEHIQKNTPLEMIKELLRSDGEKMFKFPTPQVIADNKTAWRTDEEFAREMLAGVNPVSISRLQMFPQRSTLDPKVYGDHTCTITREDIADKLDGLTVEQAIESKRLFILDHHDAITLYARRINDNTDRKIYATRTLLFLLKDGTLRPIAIELSKPHPDGDKFGCISQVYTPAEEGVEATIWQLAKAYAAVNDSGVHQLISHWLNTHAVIEPIIIATNRQLSFLHPIYKLLDPHFRDTMHINALGRQLLTSADGVIEQTCLPGQYAMEMSAVVYKSWVFPEHALPNDLLKRGMAVEDSSSPSGVRLVIEDYPYAVDGLEIWTAIKSWVSDYCNFYYKDDSMVLQDKELQAWWTETVQKGHEDKKNEPWWPKMTSRQVLIETLTTIIWISSALHAAVNFGQYSYAGYNPCRPTLSRRFMPEPGTPEYEELKTNPDKAFLETITAQFQTLLGISLIEILSRHASDEIYLGQREHPEWTSDKHVLDAFERFGKKLAAIEDRILAMNDDQKWRNRTGPVKVPYTLLFPTSEGGLTGRGIPNSISI